MGEILTNMIYNLANRAAQSNSVTLHRIQWRVLMTLGNRVARISFCASFGVGLDAHFHRQCYLSNRKRLPCLHSLI